MFKILNLLQKNDMKKFASHRLYISHLGLLLKNHVVEIDEETGNVLAYNPFTEETSFTEWLNGLIVLSDAKPQISIDGKLSIESCYPVLFVDDMKNIRCVLSVESNKTPLILKAYYITDFNITDSSFSKRSIVLPLV